MHPRSLGCSLPFEQSAFRPGPVLAAQWIQRLLSVPVCLLLEANPLHGCQLLAEMAAHASHCHPPRTWHVRTPSVYHQYLPYWFGTVLHWIHNCVAPGLSPNTCTQLEIMGVTAPSNVVSPTLPSHPCWGTGAALCWWRVTRMSNSYTGETAAGNTTVTCFSVLRAK